MFREKFREKSYFLCYFLCYFLQKNKGRNKERKLPVRNIKDIDVTGKTVILRLDLNVPIQNKTIVDNSRIVKTIPTITFLLEKKTKIIIISHLGRPKKDSKGNYPEIFSLKIVKNELSKLLAKKINWIESINERTEKAIKNSPLGEVFLMENIRFLAEETSKDPKTREALARKIAKLGDVFVNDAFGAAHRSHASTAELAKMLPSASGFLIEKEINFLGQCLKNPQRPFIVVLGGAKISDKILLIKNLLKKVDKILIGGGMSYTFLKSLGHEIGKSLVDDNLLATCEAFLKENPDKIVLPEDLVITKINFDDFTLEDKLKTVTIDSLSPEEESFDIGEKTIKKFESHLLVAKTIFWNGPMGVFECEGTAKGTSEVAKIIALATEEKKATTIIGGGDSISALKKINLLDKVSFASSGGGASLEFLEGKELPGIKALDEK